MTTPAPVGRLLRRYYARKLWALADTAEGMDRADIAEVLRMNVTEFCATREEYRKVSEYAKASLLLTILWADPETGETFYS